MLAPIGRLRVILEMSGGKKTSFIKMLGRDMGEEGV